jgi:hypothetical protein
MTTDIRPVEPETAFEKVARFSHGLSLSSIAELDEAG